MLVVLNVAATKQTAGNSYYGLAIGATVAAGAFAVGPISGAAFNPAVGVGATVASALFAHGGWSGLWLYIAGPLAGAALAAAIHRTQTFALPCHPSNLRVSRTFPEAGRRMPGPLPSPAVPR